MIQRIRNKNSLRNRLLHNSTTGVCYKTSKDGKSLIEIMFKRLSRDDGTEKPFSISLEELRREVSDTVDLINDLRRWTHTHSPNAERHVP